MKIRQGFVSNSSSSNFIVVFSKIPKDIQELKYMLFGDSNKYDLDMRSLEGVSEEDVIQKILPIILSDIKAQAPNNLTEITKCIVGLAHGYMYIRGIRGVVEVRGDYILAQDIVDKVVEKHIKKFMKQHKNKHIYIFRYGSETHGTLGSVIEFSNIFSSLCHMTINCH